MFASWIESLYKITLDVTVREVDEENLWDFIIFPYRLYAKDPNYIPPLYKTRLNLLNGRKNEFLDGNDRRCYLAYRHNLPVGCIVCGIFPDAMASGETAFFTLFEAEDDESAFALLEQATAFARQRGAREVKGPWPPDLSGCGAGFLTDDFAAPAGYLNGYNRRGYCGYAESSGFETYGELYTYCFDLEECPAGEKPLLRALRFVPKPLEAIRREEFSRYKIRALGFADGKNTACAFRISSGVMPTARRWIIKTRRLR